MELENFVSRVNDPRVKGRCLHSFFDVVVISFLAVLCGAESFCEIEEFGRARESWLREFLGLKNGIPSHDTFRRVLSIIDAKEFEVSFMKFVEAAHAKRLRRISIDGKSVAGAEPKMLNRPLQTVGVYAHDEGVVIGQDLAPNAGFGEIKTVLRLLDYFDLRKTLISIDAASSCPKIARVIREKKADYLMPLRDMGTTYLKETAELFDECGNEDVAESHDEKHGRIEDRKAQVISSRLMSKAFQLAYPSAKTMVRMTRRREKEDRRIRIVETKAGGLFSYKKNEPTTKVTTYTSYYLTSRKMTASEALQEIRDHWAIENKLHWNLDVTFREDDWRVRDRVAARNLSILRKIAYNIVAKDPSKGSQRVKIKRAAWSIEFFEKILFNPANFIA